MHQLPPGQRARDDFPRFGLNQFATRIPDNGPIAVDVTGEGCELRLDDAALSQVPRIEQVSDFHCVTTWSVRDLRWSGWRLRDVWERCIAPALENPGQVSWLVLRCRDGFRARLTLEDALAPDVLLADRLAGEPLPLEHGGPLRLVAPAHYGYKSPKYLKRIECVDDGAEFLPSTPLAMMEHPRGRVAQEERGAWPGWLLRRLYRPLVGPTVRRFRRAWEQRAPSP